MAKPGRKAKPAEMHDLAGTRRKDRHGKKGQNSQPKLATIPEKPPSYIPGYGKRFWRAAARAINQLKIGKEGDVWELESAAMMYDRARRAEKVIKEKGFYYTDPNTGTPKRHPAAIEANQCRKELRLILGELGLTPSARTGLPTEADGSPNRFLELLK